MRILTRGEQMRSDNVAFHSTITGQKAKRSSISSDDSQRVMVKKTVDISFEEDNVIQENVAYNAHAGLK